MTGAPRRNGAALFDAHLHRQDPLLAGALGDNPDFPDVAAQVTNGTHPDDWEAVKQLGNAGRTRVLKAYGVHPWKVGKLPEDWETILRRYLATGAVSVGEIGLDRWIEPRDEDRQIGVFDRQLAIAADLELPPTIHCLRAWGMLIDRLRAGPDQPRGFLVHGFGGSTEMLHQLADLGGFFSFSAYAADPRRKRMRDAARACPADRLLAETDAPDMVPPDDACAYPLFATDGKRLHHPREIGTAYARLAEWRKADPEQLTAQIGENFRSLFPGGD